MTALALSTNERSSADVRTASPVGVTCSVGAAQWRAGDSASMLVSQADEALCQAKRRGRNRIAWSLTYADS